MDADARGGSPGPSYAGDQLAAAAGGGGECAEASRDGGPAVLQWEWIDWWHGHGGLDDWRDDHRGWAYRSSDLPWWEPREDLRWSDGAGVPVDDWRDDDDRGWSYRSSELSWLDPRWSDGAGAPVDGEEEEGEVPAVAPGEPAAGSGDAYRGGGFGGVPASAAAIAGLEREQHGRPSSKRRRRRGVGGESDETAAAPAPACGVCLEDFAAGDALSVMPCAHRFHEACLAEWLGLSRLCPCCRHALPGEGEGEGRRGSHGDGDTPTTTTATGEDGASRGVRGRAAEAEPL
ncbi:hypothetical protein ACP4OV_014527 [Aristida adscensionis]